MTGLPSPAASMTETFRGLPQKEDRMPANEPVPISLDEVISEIATTLARGYMRHRNGRRIAPDSGGGAEHVAQVEESEAVMEKRLDLIFRATEAFIRSRVNALRLRCGRPPAGRSP